MHARVSELARKPNQTKPVLAKMHLWLEEWTVTGHAALNIAGIAGIAGLHKPIKLPGTADMEYLTNFGNLLDFYIGR